MSAFAVLSKRKRDLRNELPILEKQIFDLETTYLEETRDSGNVFVGWAQLIDAERGRPKRVPLNEEKHFSLSSVTSPASRALSRREDQRRRETLSAGKHPTLPSLVPSSLRSGCQGDRGYLRRARVGGSGGPSRGRSFPRSQGRG